MPLVIGQPAVVNTKKMQHCTKVSIVNPPGQDFLGIFTYIEQTVNADTGEVLEEKALPDIILNQVDALAIAGAPAVVFFIKNLSYHLLTAKTGISGTVV
jgi:hypothetical protein